MVAFPETRDVFDTSRRTHDDNSFEQGYVRLSLLLSTNYAKKDVKHRRPHDPAQLTVLHLFFEQINGDVSAVFLNDSL